MVEAQEKINATWSRSAKNYNDIINDELNSFRTAAWKEQILSNAPQKEQLKILDCGCGPGFFATIMAEEGHEVYAIDGSDVMMEYARARAKEHNLNITYEIMDCHELEYPDDSFDLIISRNVTHALRDHYTVYNQWKRVLKPDGVLLIFDANWHLTRPDGPFYEESERRRIECLKKYGDDFSGHRDKPEDIKEKTQSELEEESMWKHTLKDTYRPDWDVGLLKGIGFTEVSYDRNIIDKLWDDKEKLIYGNTPMFMIKARP